MPTKYVFIRPNTETQRILIGRKKEVHIQIEDMNISKANSAIWFDKKTLKWFIKDGDMDENGNDRGAPSQNGTYLGVSTLIEQ